MDSPKRTQKRMTGWVVSTKPSGPKARTRERLPSWKIQTSAPKLARMERLFMTSALSGRTTERSSTNSTRYVVTRMNSPVRGKSWPMRSTTSFPSAPPPPRRGPRPRRAHGQDERRELALAELAGEDVVGLARGHVGRQDRRVGGVEAHVQERRAEQEQEGQRGHEDAPGVVHDPVRQAFPVTATGSGRVFRSGPPPSAHAQRLEPRPHEREARRQQGQRGEHGEADDDGPGDAQRAQDHELEEDQADHAQ